MPWSGKSFASKHNHKLNPTKARKAASMANAMLGAGVPEGIAIATANKRVMPIDSNTAISSGMRGKVAGGVTMPQPPSAQSASPSPRAYGKSVSRYGA